MTRPALVTFDLTEIASVRDLHLLMARTLDFPDWYGPTGTHSGT